MKTKVSILFCILCFLIFDKRVLLCSIDHLCVCNEPLLSLQVVFQLENQLLFQYVLNLQILCDNLFQLVKNKCNILPTIQDWHFRLWLTCCLIFDYPYVGKWIVILDSAWAHRQQIQRTVLYLTFSNWKLCIELRLRLCQDHQIWNH